MSAWLLYEKILNASFNVHFIQIVESTLIFLCSCITETLFYNNIGLHKQQCYNIVFYKLENTSKTHFLYSFSINILAFSNVLTFYYQKIWQTNTTVSMVSDIVINVSDFGSKLCGNKSNNVKKKLNYRSLRSRN